MQLPIDIKEVFDAATDIDEATQTPLSLTIFMDETAPGDIQALVRQAFASASPYAKISSIYFPSFPVTPPHDADIAIIVAGVNEEIGLYAANLRKAGIPTMVVTTLPELVYQISESAGNPLLKDDIIGPVEAAKRRKALLEQAGVDLEPYSLDGEKTALVLKKMGEWVIATCREKRLTFALAFSFIRKPLSLEAVNATAAQNAGVGLVVFIPGADMPIMTLNQAKMLLQIAAAYGQPMNVDRVKELAAVVGGAFAFRSVARQAVAFVPALGWAIKAAIGYTGTVAMGYAAIEYFEGGGSVSGLAEVVSKARDKVMQAADTVTQQPSVKAALKNVGSKVSKTAENAARKIVPVASAAVGSAADFAAGSGVISNEAAKKTNKVTEKVSQHYRQER